MPPIADDAGAELQWFRAYLALLARLQLDPRLQGKVDLSGVVQQTLLEAYQALDLWRGLDENRKLAWLRKALANNLKDEIDKLKTQGRDIQREISLDAALEASSARLEVVLAGCEPSPSEKAIKNEELLRLAAALDQLSEDRRRAVELCHLQGLKLKEAAQIMGKSKAAVAQLVHRGLQDLERLLEPE
jgi:RNA polymerase sigma-70 factor (subfamily 1)